MRFHPAFQNPCPHLAYYLLLSGQPFIKEGQKKMYRLSMETRGGGGRGAG